MAGGGLTCSASLDQGREFVLCGAVSSKVVRIVFVVVNGTDSVPHGTPKYFLTDTVARLLLENIF